MILNLSKEKAAAAEKKALEQERKEMYEKQKLDRKEERAKYREKVNDNHLSIED